MKLQTIVDIAPSAWTVGYDDRILLLGSCFADSVGEQMCRSFLPATCNPFGTLYNPLSVAQALTLDAVPPLVEYGGLWHAMTHHGDYSFPTEGETREAVSRSINRMQQALREATIVIVTFGTAWVYELAGRVVGNCHKLPSDRFTRRRLTVEEIITAWQPLLNRYPDKRWLFTVSPIRHIKDGLHANQLSKAVLLQAVDRLENENQSAAYFPSYEIMLDELRDYRFYAADMVHPSETAVQYIFDRFTDTYMTDATRAAMRELHQLWLDMHHRPLHPDTPEARAFAERLEQRRTEMQRRYPQLRLDNDI